MSAARHVTPREEQDRLRQGAREMDRINRAIAAGKGDILEPRRQSRKTQAMIPAPPSLALRPQLVPPLDWTERAEYRRGIEESERLLPIGRAREAELIREAEHEAERRHLWRKARLLERIAAANSTRSEP
jgi:hypothetical protein